MTVPSCFNTVRFFSPAGVQFTLNEAKTNYNKLDLAVRSRVNKQKRKKGLNSSIRQKLAKRNQENFEWSILMS